MQKFYSRLTEIWICIAAIFLAAFSFAFLGEQNLGAKTLICLGCILTVAGITVYETKVYIGMAFIGLSEIVQGLANTILGRQNGVIGITVESVLGFIILFSSVIIATIKLRKERKSNKIDKINLNTVLNTEATPYKTSWFINLLLVGMIAVIVASMSTTYLDINKAVSPISMLYVMLPTFILLVTIVPTSIAIYIRLLYYTLWIWMLGMGISVGMVSEVNLIEPIVYMVSVIIGRICYVKPKFLSKKTPVETIKNVEDSEASKADEISSGGTDKTDEESSSEETKQ